MELRIPALLLLLAGWILMLSAVILLPALASRTTFALAGLAVQFLGLILLASAHIPKKKRNA
jgi:hypothetical protein